MKINTYFSRKKIDFCFYLKKISQKRIPARKVIYGYCLSLLFIGQLTASGLSINNGGTNVLSNNISPHFINLPGSGEAPMPLHVDIQISGTVTDENGAPLPGASITVLGTSSGTVTDIDGNYSITVPEEADLVFSYIGYESKTVAVGTQTTIDITLLQDASSLDEVVVVGYGTVKKSDLTGSVSSIQADKLNTDSQGSVEQIIQGRLPGVQVTQASARPGGNFSIRIRGSNSITAGNEPLYVIDGLPGANPENSLNPSDIKSIEVLKDASATSIYGARGSNGVVLITTKNGKQNSPLTISYNATTSIQSATKTLDMMNAQQYMSFYNDVYSDRGLEPIFSQNDFTSIGAGTNWQNEIFRSAPIQEHRLSFSGGSEDTQYYLSLNAFDQDGIVISSGFKRFSGRINLTHSVGDKLAAYKPLRTSPRLSAVVSALGASIVFSNALMLIYGPNPKVYPQGLLPTTVLYIFGLPVPIMRMIILATSIIIMIGLYVFIQKTRIGTAIRAAAIDQDAARLMGINVDRVIMLVFFIGPALGGAAGLMVGLYYGQINFTMGWLYGLKAFTAAILGGIG
ncbi:MAG: SusC/RagA family TonB-linked outer membrane protein, partial [Cyclobacterium sp.]|uniref:SusC/RagA family TonB-linked outer membrane protein n=1 Tax=Cyclobacterium sp. TaxID=1966343 RepID=UPI0039704FD9